MRIKDIIHKKKGVVLSLIILLGLIIYSVAATKSGLWYDEAIEYFYSRFMTGPTPGSRFSTNMYERICSTYQPPIYNVLMYFWLLFFDSEFGFRFAGIIATFAGSVAIYLFIREHEHDSFWSMAGTAFYIFSSGIAYYGLECAEYNFMLCFLSWAQYFWLCSLNKKNLGSFTGFLIFSCLSVYSQYGAAFIVAGMYLYLVISFIREKNVRMIKVTVIASVIVFVVAVMPLLVFFALPQLENQGTISVSHKPQFKGNIFFDYIFGIVHVIWAVFAFNSWGIMKYCNAAGVGIAAVLTFIAFWLKKKRLRHFVIVLAGTYTVYYIAVACSYYAYNAWNGNLGTSNLGERYTLFLAPFIIVTLICGIRNFLVVIYEKVPKYYKLATTLGVLLIAGFCMGEIVRLDIVPWEKDDVRELTEAWYENEIYDSDAVTFLQYYEDPVFHFYLMHDGRYDESYLENIEVVYSWTETDDYDVIKENITNLGWLQLNEFCFSGQKILHTQSFPIIRKIMNENHYAVEEIYSGKSVLLHVIKMN